MGERERRDTHATHNMPMETQPYDLSTAEMAYTTRPMANYDMAQCYHAGLPAVNLGFSLPPAAPPLKSAIGYSQYVNPDEFAYIDCDVFDKEELFEMGTDAEHWADDLSQTLGLPESANFHLEQLMTGVPEEQSSHKATLKDAFTFLMKHNDDQLPYPDTISAADSQDTWTNKSLVQQLPEKLNCGTIDSLPSLPSFAQQMNFEQISSAERIQEQPDLARASMRVAHEVVPRTVRKYLLLADCHASESSRLIAKRRRLAVMQSPRFKRIKTLRIDRSKNKNRQTHCRTRQRGSDGKFPTRNKPK